MPTRTWLETSASEPCALAMDLRSMLIQHCTSVLQAKVKRVMGPEGLLVELRMPK